MHRRRGGSRTAPTCRPAAILCFHRHSRFVPSILVAQGLAQTRRVGSAMPRRGGFDIPGGPRGVRLRRIADVQRHVCASPGLLYRVLCFHRHSRMVRRFFDVRDPISSQGPRVPSPPASPHRCESGPPARFSTDLCGLEVRAPREMRKLQTSSLTRRVAALSSIMQGRAARAVWPVGISLEPSSTKPTPPPVPPQQAPAPSSPRRRNT